MLGISTALTSIENIVTGWGNAFQGAALSLFGVLFAVELAWFFISFALGKKTHVDFPMSIMKKVIVALFFVSAINAASQWGPDIVQGLSQGGVQIAGLPYSTAGQLMNDAFTVFGDVVGSGTSGAEGAIKTALIGSPSSGLISGVVNSAENAVFGSLAGALALIVALLLAIVLTIAVAWIAIEVFVTQLEALFVTSIGVILLAGGASRWTIKYSGAWFDYAVNVGFKLMILEIIAALDIEQVIPLIEKLLSTTTGSSLITNIVGSLVLSLLVIMLAKKAPAIAQAMLSGQSGAMGAGDVAAPVIAAGATAAAATGVGMAAAGAGMAAAGAAAKSGMSALKSASSGGGNSSNVSPPSPPGGPGNGAAGDGLASNVSPPASPASAGGGANPGSAPTAGKQDLAGETQANKVDAPAPNNGQTGGSGSAATSNAGSSQSGTGNNQPSTDSTNQPSTGSTTTGGPDQAASGTGPTGPSQTSTSTGTGTAATPATPAASTGATPAASTGATPTSPAPTTGTASSVGAPSPASPASAGGGAEGLTRPAPTADVTSSGGTGGSESGANGPTPPAPEPKAPSRIDTLKASLKNLKSIHDDVQKLANVQNTTVGGRFIDPRFLDD